MRYIKIQDNVRNLLDRKDLTHLEPELLKILRHRSLSHVGSDEVVTVRGKKERAHLRLQFYEPEKR